MFPAQAFKSSADSSGIKKKTLISSQKSLLYLSSDHRFEYFTYTAEFCSSKDPEVDHMLPLLLKAYRGEAQFGTQMPGSCNLALSCFVLN